ncbi:hypothetical protein AB0B28_19845 [Glycomyces sp. NPDC046736]|uniref:hypothetical protein n=1 Tax=Glycomyces sp. NPDC046736 TaxID=3155615 RepID=UPI0033FEC40D
MATIEEHREEWFKILDGYPDHEKPDPEDRLAVETSCSGFLGNMWTRASIPEVQGVSLPELEMVFIQYYLRRADAFGAAMLAAMTELADAPGGRRAASKAVERLKGLGVPVPSWHGEELTLGECWKAGDHYGDQLTFFCSFHAPSGDHALSYTVDYSEYHFDMVVDCDATDRIERLLELHRDRNAKFPDRLFVPVQAEPAELGPGTRRSLQDWDIFCVEGDPTRLAPRYLMLRELWKARMRLLPQVEPEEISKPSDDELSMFASGFVGHVLGEIHLSEPHFEAIQELCWFHGINGPKVSPTRAFVFLERYLPSKYEPGDPVVEAVGQLYLPFLRWAASATDLRPEAWPYFKHKTEKLLSKYPNWTAKDPDSARIPRPRSL